MAQGARVPAIAPLAVIALVMVGGLSAFPANLPHTCIDREHEGQSGRHLPASDGRIEDDGAVVPSRSLAHRAERRNGPAPDGECADLDTSAREVMRVGDTRLELMTSSV